MAQELVGPEGGSLSVGLGELVPLVEAAADKAVSHSGVVGVELIGVRVQVPQFLHRMIDVRGRHECVHEHPTVLLPVLRRCFEVGNADARGVGISAIADASRGVSRAHGLSWLLARRRR